MQKTDNNIVNLFEKSNPGFHKFKIAESMNLKRGGSIVPDYFKVCMSFGTKLLSKGEY